MNNADRILKSYADGFNDIHKNDNMYLDCDNNITFLGQQIGKIVEIENQQTDSYQTFLLIAIQNWQARKKAWVLAKKNLLKAAYNYGYTPIFVPNLDGLFNMFGPKDFKITHKDIINLMKEYSKYEKDASITIVVKNGILLGLAIDKICEIGADITQYLLLNGDIGGNNQTVNDIIEYYFTSQPILTNDDGENEFLKYCTHIEFFKFNKYIDIPYDTSDKILTRTFDEYMRDLQYEKYSLLESKKIRNIYNHSIDWRYNNYNFVKKEKK